MKRVHSFWRTEGTSVIGSAFLVAAALLAFGTPNVPSLSAATTTCQSSPLSGCCACYTSEDGYQCHDGAAVGASYCDSGTEFCSRSVCMVVPE